ncbi:MULTISPECIES: hypothetical protein [unclassified Nocardioides]|uniref:hypothetical protein n=1 Tax=unclassified Nocardioides TaxID=2615069 RepID=UPI0006F57794|nr:MULTISPECIES: hypothetical protein [unclassified Nocardioides]KRA39041.1 hypothetical protein ASD81_10820 [Nocardioides sp. Root614]KRA93000.1 hypothetical protein ASD84_11085 [Nocardioides sp. Root682]
MTVPFGPQLIGQTEKSLGALLEALLAGRVSEPEWVTLRVAHLAASEVHSEDDLVAQVGERAHFADATELVAVLTGRGLLADGAPTPVGTALVEQVQARIAEVVGPVWAGLDLDDVAAAERVLNEVLRRTTALLA